MTRRVDRHRPPRGKGTRGTEVVRLRNHYVGKRELVLFCGLHRVCTRLRKDSAFGVEVEGDVSEVQGQRDEVGTTKTCVEIGGRADTEQLTVRRGPPVGL